MAIRSEIVFSVSSLAMRNRYIFLPHIEQFFFVGCVLRTATVKFLMNFVNDTVCNGAPSAPYTFPKQATL